jgi:hypothetical protein
MRTAAVAMLMFSIALSLGVRPAEARATAETEEPYWQQEANYTIKASLDTKERVLSGTETITYTNNSPDTLIEFHLHLYANAFREKTSPLIRDYLQGTLYFFVGLPESMRGWIDVADLAVNGAASAFSVDGTILTSAFPKPLLPGETASIALSFSLQIMRRLGRMGWSGDQFDMAQWYPKMVVYDRDGWHPDQYRMGEFYGEFGAFDVHITLPETYVVAATGVPVSGDPGWTRNPLRRVPAAGSGGGGHPGGRPAARAAAAAASEATKTLHFRAENVHDFAWCANPSFIVQDTTHNGVRIMSFFRPWNRAWADTTLAHALRSVQWLETVAGPFPYPQVSIVDCSTRGGMEYPMLVMNGSVDESLVLHEIAHNYFYGALGNNERAEAWLDEGFVQYLVFRNAEEKHGPYGEPSKRRWPFSIFRERRMWDDIEKPVVRLHRTGFAERIATPVHEFKNGFNTMPYIGAPLFLRALRYTVGDESFRAIIATYVERWKYKHVDEEAFRDVCEEVSGMDLKEMFRQWLHSTKSCDYRLARFKTTRTKDGWSADLRIDRKGELMMPVTLAVRLADGNTVTERFDGVSRTTTDTLRFEARPVWAAINPENEILDVYRLDNVLPRQRHYTLDVPGNAYYPPDAYSLRFLPFGMYNDVDGGKAGLRLRGSFDDAYRKLTLLGAYGFESGAVDVYGSYRHPAGYFGRDASLFASGFIREGRKGASLEIAKIRRKSLYDPLAHTIRLGLVYHELTDETYVFPFTYEKGLNFKGRIGVSIAPKTDIFESNLDFSLERTMWGSDFDTEKLGVSLALSPGIRADFLPVKPYLRFFLGRAMVDAPVQERFQLAGAGTLAKENYFWLRSVGAWPKDHYGNFHVPGDANLRGYYDGTFAFKQVFASNVELELPFPLPVGRKLARALDRRLYLFFDWGKVMDARPLEGLAPWVRGSFDENCFDEMLLDAGVGVSLWKLTAEFPLYLSHPALVGQDEKWDLRWTIGFKRLF